MYMLIILDYVMGKVQFEFIPNDLQNKSGFESWFDCDTYLNELGYDVNNIHYMLTTEENKTTITNKLKGFKDV
tara:strand:+ start:1593 stop:1811 length:219 start_codon:yes stop_codon:yes gene_type:complete